MPVLLHHGIRTPPVDIIKNNCENITFPGADVSCNKIDLKSNVRRICRNKEQLNIFCDVKVISKTFSTCMYLSKR